MELLRQATSAQVLYPAAAVAAVLLCAALVFILGFHSAEQPQFDKLPLVVDDRKSASKKRKTKDKKSSPNRSANEDGKTKSESKKSPAKENKEVKETEKSKPKEKPVDQKPLKKEQGEAKKTKKVKNAEAEKPVDFDEGVWEEVPKKSEKKKVKTPEEKKESPIKKNKKKSKEADVEAAQSATETADFKVVVNKGPVVDEEAARALEAQVAEMQRVLKEVELREQAALGQITLEEDVSAEEMTEELVEVKDLRSNKKKENKEKQRKKSESGKGKGEPAEKDAPEAAPEQTGETQNVAVFDELGDSWSDAKVKKGKKKARKDQ